MSVAASVASKSLPIESAARLSVLQSRIRGMMLGGIIGDCFGTRFNDVGVGALPMMDVAESMSYRTLAPALSKLSNGKWLFRLSSDGYMMLEATKNVLDGGDSNSLREKLVGLMTDPSMNHLKWGSGITSVLSGNAPKASELRGNTVMVRSLPAALFPDEEYENIFYQLADAVPTHEVARKKAKSLADACKAALKSGIFDPTMIKDKATVSALQLATPANYDEISMNLQKRLAARVGQNAMASTTLPVVAFAMKQGEVGEEVHGKDETTEMGGISLDPSMFSPNILNRSNRLDLAQEFYEETANASPTFGQNEMHLILSWAISCGGDTRTSGCLAGALAGATYGVEQIPNEWIATCEGSKEAIAVADRVFDEIYLNNPILLESIVQSISVPVREVHVPADGTA